MSNLKGSGTNDIGLNYKSILSVGTANNGLGTVSSTLQTITDGDGNTTPFQLSNTQIGMLFNGVTNPIVFRANSTLTDYAGWHDNSGNFVVLKKQGNPLWINTAEALNFSNGFGSSGRSSIDANGNWTVGGAFTNSGRVHIKDESNTILRIEGTASQSIRFYSTGGMLRQDWQNGSYFESGNSVTNWYAASITTHYVTWTTNGSAYTLYPVNNISPTSGAHAVATYIATFASATGSANMRYSNYSYTINNSGAQTGTLTGIFLNATETNLNGITHNLMDLQVGNSTAFKVISRSVSGVPSNPSLELSGTTGAYIQLNRAGSMNWYIQASSGKTDYSQVNGKHNFQGHTNTMITFGDVTSAFPALKRNGAVLEARLADDSAYAIFSPSNIISYGNRVQMSGLFVMQSPSDGVITFQNNATNDFGRLQFGGTTNAFPALKRNGAELQVRLADDSAYAGIDVNTIKVNGSFAYDGGSWYFTSVTFGNSTTNIQNNHGVNYRLGNLGLTIGANDNPDSSSILEIRSTAKGFLPPRMTTSQRDAISSPAAGLMVYNTTTNRPNFFDGTNWVAL